MLRHGNLDHALVGGSALSVGYRENVMPVPKQAAHYAGVAALVGEKTHWLVD